MTDDLKHLDSEVGALLSERIRYEGWLRALEDRREATPPHIYDRVHADYSDRLRRVLERLGGHRAGIEEMIRKLEERLASVQAEERQFQDERSEAELRAMVGEFSDEQCADVLRRSEEGIAGLAEEKARLSAELERYREVLDGSSTSAAGPPPRPSPVAAARVDEQILLDEDPLAEEAGGDLPAGQETAPPASHGRVPPPADAFDELEFLKTVVVPGQGRAAEPVTQESTESEEPEPAPAEVNPAEGMPSFLRTTPAEQVKTLRCQECNTMNYPTEWYCERCGAELAAL